MGRVETTYAVVLEYPCDGLLTHIGSLLWCRYCLEQIEKPVRTDVVGKLQHLWIIAPELAPEAICETAVLNLELLVDARPFSELDDNGLGDGELAICPHIGSQAVRQNISVATIVLGTRHREAVAKAIELFGIDRINVEIALEQCLDDWAVRRLDADMDVTRFASACLQQPGNHVGESVPAVSEPPLSDFLTCVIVQRDDMLLRSPINTHEPSSFFIHHALSVDWRHMPAPIDRARKQCEPHRDPNLFLYRRSRRELPTGRWSRPLHRGTSPREALSKLIRRRRSHMVAPGESARSRKIAAVRAVARWGTRRFATLHSACPSGNYLLKGPRKRHTGATLARRA